MISNISLNLQLIFTFVDQNENSENNLAKDVRNIQKNLFIFSSYPDDTTEKIISKNFIIYCKSLNYFLMSVIVMFVFAELISGPEIMISNESEICES